MSDDRPSEPSPAEMAAITGVTLQLAQALAGDSVCRLAIELPQDVDKHRVIYLGVLPLIAADAARRRRGVVWLAPQGGSEARAKNRMRELLDPRPA